LRLLLLHSWHTMHQVIQMEKAVPHTPEHEIEALTVGGSDKVHSLLVMYDRKGRGLAIGLFLEVRTPMNNAKSWLLRHYGR
jgi:hypothetical protein